MEIDPAHRITSLRGAIDMKTHPWFRPLNKSWKEIDELKLVPSFVPGLDEDEIRISGVVKDVLGSETTSGNIRTAVNGLGAHGFSFGDDDYEDDAVGIRPLSGMGMKGGISVANLQKSASALNLNVGGTGSVLGLYSSITNAMAKQIDELDYIFAT
jgi:hypothetical protein